MRKPRTAFSPSASRVSPPPRGSPPNTRCAPASACWFCSRRIFGTGPCRFAATRPALASRSMPYLTASASRSIYTRISLAGFVDLPVSPRRGVQAVLLLRLRVRLLRTLGQVFINLGNRGLSLRQHLMEADNLLLSLLGVVAEAIAGLHRIHQNVGRVREGEGLAQGVVSAAQPCHGAGKAIHLIAASCKAGSPAHLHRDPVFDAPSRDGNHSGQRITLEGPSALACRSCMCHRHAVCGHGYWRPVSRQPQLV